MYTHLPFATLCPGVGRHGDEQVWDAMLDGLMDTVVDDAGSLLAAGYRALDVHGDLRESRRWFDLAYGAAASPGDPYAMAEAALGLSGLPSVPRSSEAGLEPGSMSVRASSESISREFNQPGA
jgi:hypothetical protein